MGFVLGGKPEHETWCFSVSSGCSRQWKVPRVCGGCGLGSAKAGSSQHCNGCFDVFCFFLHIAVTWCFGIFACKTHCNGCMNVAWASFWAGRPEHETLCFSVSSGCSRRWKEPHVCGGCGLVRPRLGVVRTVMAASMCFAYSRTLQLHGVLESLLAKLIVSAASRLLGATAACVILSSCGAGHGKSM